MTQAPQSDPHLRIVARFLGSEAATGSPFDLLGLDPNGLSEDLIRVGLARRLEELDLHQEASTPDAEELRLTLHATASQLSHPDVRGLLIKRWGGISARRAAQTATQSTGATPQRAPQQPASGTATAGQSLVPTERAGLGDVLAILVLEKGINARSVRHIAAIARARRLPAASIPQLIRAALVQLQPSQPAQAQVASAPVAPPGATPHHESDQEPVSHAANATREWIGIGVLASIILVSVAIVVVGWGRISSALFPAPPSPIVQMPVQRAERPEPDQASPSALGAPLALVPSSPSGNQDDPEVVIHALRSALSRVNDDPDASVASFTNAAMSARSLWHRMDPDQLDTAVDLLRSGFVAAQARSESSVRMLGVFSVQQVLPTEAIGSYVSDAVWCESNLSALLAEPRLNSELNEQARQLLGEMIGGQEVFAESFDLASQRSLVRVAATLVQRDASADAWTLWLLCADTALIEGSNAHQRVVLSALDAALRADQSRDVAVPIRFLSEPVDWGAGSAASSSLLGWLDDTDVPSARLAVLTSALTESSRTQGIDATMVLDATATEAQRNDLRARYAAAGAPAQTRTWEWAEWQTLASLAATREREPAWSNADFLAETIVLSRLNESAQALRQGRVQDAGRLVSDLRSDIDAFLAAPAAQQAQSNSIDPDAAKDWALRYIRAGSSIPARMALLAELEGPQAIGEVAAEILVAEALGSNQREVRLRSAEIVIVKGREASILAALLAELPSMPRIRPNSEFITSVTGIGLPAVNDPEWPAAARRSLLESLLASLALPSGGSALDDLSVLLAESYAGRAAGGSPQQSADAVLAARSLFQELRAEARQEDSGATLGLGVPQVDRRRAGRLATARGIIQRFAAEQATILELRAIVTAAKSPARVGEIREILAEARKRRRDAASVFDQMYEVERKVLSINLIDLSGSDS